MGYRDSVTDSIYISIETLNYACICTLTYTYIIIILLLILLLNYLVSSIGYYARIIKFENRKE